MRNRTMCSTPIRAAKSRLKELSVPVVVLSTVRVDGSGRQSPTDLPTRNCAPPANASATSFRLVLSRYEANPPSGTNRNFCNWHNTRRKLKKGEHPLNRIMGVKEDDQGIVIETTD